jgi:suppressor for copper-sensitivity B
MALLLLITSLWLINVLVELVSKNSEFSDSNSSNKSIINWNINDDINLPNELVREGKTVFIDITADWCLTCKVNKFFVIDTKEITELFKKNNVNVLRLDWTKPNEKIKQFLAKKGRYGIPFNEIYSPLIPNGKIFPELLTLKVIKEYLDIAK